MSQVSPSWLPDLDLGSSRLCLPELIPSSGGLSGSPVLGLSSVLLLMLLLLCFSLE